MEILFLGVLHIYIITIVYQQSREQKRVGGQLAPVSPNSIIMPYKGIIVCTYLVSYVVQLFVVQPGQFFLSHYWH